MRNSKKELKNYFKNLYPLNINLIFEVYKKLNFNEVQFKIPIGKINKRNKYLFKSNSKNQNFRVINLKFNEFIKYVASNIFNINNKDIGYLYSNDLYSIFISLKETWNLNKLTFESKIHIYSIIRYHIIYILGLFLSSNESNKIIIYDLIDLLLKFDIKIEDIFFNIQCQDLLQIYNLTHLFLNKIQNIDLNINFSAKLQTLIHEIINLCEIKIKRHLNLLLKYLFVEPEYINLMENDYWLNLLKSDDIIILNEDILLYFFFKNLHYFHTNNIFNIIKFDHLSDFAKKVYNQYKDRYLFTNFLFDKKKHLFPINIFLNNKYLSSLNSKNELIFISIKSKFLHISTNDNILISDSNKSFIINHEMNIQDSFVFEIHFKNKTNFDIYNEFNELLNFLSLYIGISIGNNCENCNNFLFQLNSNLNKELYFNNDQISILKLNYHQLLNIGIYELNNFNDSFSIDKKTSNYKNNIKNKNPSFVNNSKFDSNYLKMKSSNHKKDPTNLSNDLKLIWYINLKNKYILLEFSDFYSLYIKISLNDDLLINNSIFPLISYNYEYFDLEINYCHYNLSKLKNTELNSVSNTIYNGSKTLRKFNIYVNKKISGAPKRTTRLRPIGSSNMSFTNSMNQNYRVDINNYKEKSYTNNRIKIKKKKLSSRVLIKNSKNNKNNALLSKLKKLNHLFIDQSINIQLKHAITTLYKYLLSNKCFNNCFNRFISFFKRIFSF